jgi:cation:H+ antiporter
MGKDACKSTPARGIENVISIFIFISGATLLVYSAERLISSLVGVSRGLAISVFLLAIIFTGIEFDDIVLGIALNLEGNQDVALGLVLGTAVSFSGVVLALGAILTPTTFSIPREYILVFALAPLIMLVFAIRKEVTTVDAVVLLLVFVAWIAYVAVRESKRETATFRNLEIIEEAEEQEEEVATSIPGRAEAVDTISVFGRQLATSNPGQAQAVETMSASSGDARPAPVRAQAADTRSPFSRQAATSTPAHAQAVDTMSLFSRQGRWSGWINVGLAALAICGIVIGAATVSDATDQILDRYGIEGTVFGATILTAVLCIEDLFLTARPIRRGVPEIGIGNVIGSLIFSVSGKLAIVVLAGGSVAIGSSVLRWHLPALVVLTGVAACFMWTGHLKRWHGVVLLALYVAYWVVSYVVYGGAPVED